MTVMVPAWRWRRLPLRVATLLVPAIAVATAWSLAAPAASHAAVSVLRLGYCGGDDWEPTMASDSSHVYVLITHFTGDTTCDPASGQNNSRIMIQVSSDGGQTFTVPSVVSNTPGGIAYPSQADPSIAVDKATGAVYVSLLAYGLSGGHTDIYVARSTNFGQSFGQAVQANAKGCKNCDHEKILASNNVIYDAYTQAQYHFVSVSTDGGATFTQQQVDSTFVVGFAEGGVLDSHGNAWFAWGDCETSNCTGTPAADYRVSETLAGGGATTFSPAIGQSPQGPDCPYSSCGFAYYGGQDAIAIDSAGAIPRVGDRAGGGPAQEAHGHHPVALLVELHVGGQLVARGQGGRQDRGQLRGLFLLCAVSEHRGGRARAAVRDLDGRQERLDRRHGRSRGRIQPVVSRLDE